MTIVLPLLGVFLLIGVNARKLSLGTNLLMFLTVLAVILVSYVRT